MLSTDKITLKKNEELININAPVVSVPEDESCFLPLGIMEEVDIDPSEIECEDGSLAYLDSIVAEIPLPALDPNKDLTLTKKK